MLGGIGPVLSLMAFLRYLWRPAGNHSAARAMGRPSARPTHDLTSLIISSIERIAALCGVAPTLKEQHMWTGCVARISPTSFSATVSTLPISRSLWICSSGGSSGNGTSLPHGFVADYDPTRGQQLLHHAQPERKAEI